MVWQNTLLACHLLESSCVTPKFFQDCIFNCLFTFGNLHPDYYDAPLTPSDSALIFSSCRDVFRSYIWINGRWGQWSECVVSWSLINPCILITDRRGLLRANLLIVCDHLVLVIAINSSWQNVIHEQVCFSLRSIDFFHASQFSSHCWTCVVTANIPHSSIP